MNIWLGTYLNLTHLTILNANFHSYQLNNCNCLFNCFSDITKLFCCRFNASKGKLFTSIFPPNWLADELACRQIYPVELSPAQLVPPNCLASNTIPHLWKRTIIIPIPKPNKD